MNAVKHKIDAKVFDQSSIKELRKTFDSKIKNKIMNFSLRGTFMIYQFLQSIFGLVEYKISQDHKSIPRNKSLLNKSQDRTTPKSKSIMSTSKISQQNKCILQNQMNSNRTLAEKIIGDESINGRPYAISKLLRNKVRRQSSRGSSRGSISCRNKFIKHNSKLNKFCK